MASAGRPPLPSGAFGRLEQGPLPAAAVTLPRRALLARPPSPGEFFLPGRAGTLGSSAQPESASARGASPVCASGTLSAEGSFRRPKLTHTPSQLWPEALAELQQARPTAPPPSPPKEKTPLPAPRLLRQGSSRYRAALLQSERFKASASGAAADAAYGSQVAQLRTALRCAPAERSESQLRLLGDWLGHIRLDASVKESAGQIWTDLAREVTYHVVQAGERIFPQGSVGSDFFAVFRGEVALFVAGPNQALRADEVPIVNKVLEPGGEEEKDDADFFSSVEREMERERDSSPSRSPFSPGLPHRALAQGSLSSPLSASLLSASPALLPHSPPKERVQQLQQAQQVSRWPLPTPSLGGGGDSQTRGGRGRRDSRRGSDRGLALAHAEMAMAQVLLLLVRITITMTITITYHHNHTVLPWYY
ncbi:hypothetical protein T492DRAFT_1152447 [Pavlovales sp. CCMP2436]|nr:hypothetical protein T492DRAFT_1152447 [Pavlovales sp. CCMP2436]